MLYDLPQEVLDSLPEPDTGGLIQIKAGLRLQPDGKARIVEVNGVSIGSDSEEEEESEEILTEPDSEEPMSTPSDVAADIYGAMNPQAAVQ